MSFRFVHAADLHLDSPLVSRSSTTAARLREAFAVAFSRLIQLCVDEDVHALLLAGDTLDGQRLSMATEVMLLEGLERLARRGTTVLIATGNHDPGESEGTMHALPWPDGCHLIRDENVVRVSVTDRAGTLRGTVDSVGFASRHEDRSLALALVPPSPRSVPAVAMAHAQVVESRGAGQHLPYAPIHVADLEVRPFDYWALGHVHLRQQVLERPAAWYPGNLQGRHFKEEGPKGALLVEIPGPGRPPRVAFRSLAPVRFATLEVGGLGDVRDPMSLIEKVGAPVRALLGEAREDEGLCLRVRWAGPCPLAHRVDEEELAEEIRRRWNLIEVTCDTHALHPVLDMEALARREPLVAAVCDIDQELRDGVLTLDRLVGDDVPFSANAPDLREILEEALDGMDVSIAAALLESEGDVS